MWVHNAPTSKWRSRHEVDWPSRDLKLTNKQLFEPLPICWVTEAPSPCRINGTALSWYLWTLRTGWWRRAGCWPTSDQNFGTKLGSSRIHLFQASVFHSLIHVTSGGKSGIGNCLTVDPPVLLPTFTGILCSERVNIGAGSFRSRSLLMFEMCWPEVPICDNRIHELILPYPAFCRSLLAACVMRWISTPEISPQTHAESNSSTRSDLMLSASKKLSSKFAAFLAVVRRMELQNDSLLKDVLSNTPNSNKMCVQ